MDAATATACRDAVAIARMAANWIAEAVASVRDRYSDGQRTEPRLFVAEDLRDSANRLEALIPGLPVIAQMRASLAPARELPDEEEPERLEPGERVVTARDAIVEAGQ